MHKILLLLLSIYIAGCNVLQPPTPSFPEPAPLPSKPAVPDATPKNGSTQKPKVNPQNSTTGQKVLLQMNTQQTYAVNANLLGFSTGFMFTTPMDEQPEVQNITRTLAPKILRFSGGTISSYYHPEGLGYGFKEDETYGKMKDLIKTQALFHQNALIHFADLCKISNSKALYDANMLTGTIDEMVQVLDYLKSRNIDIIGVELGNEYFFKAYADKFPDVQTYIEKCKPYAKVLRSKYPNLKIAVTAAMPVDMKAKGEFATFMRTWDQLLGKETFYDAYTVHLYPKGEVCEKNAKDNIKDIFPCTDVTLAVQMHNYHKITNDYFKQFYGNKKYWITEWNIDKPNMLSNTFTNAAFAAEFIMGMISHNIDEGDLIEIATFHNYGSAGFAYPIFSYATSGVPTINKDKTIAYNATYYPFLILAQIVQSGAEVVKDNINYPEGITNQFLNIQSFITKDKKKLYVFFENKSGKEWPLELEDKRWNSIQYQALEANFPWSVAGMNGFYKKQPNLVDRMEWIQKPVTNSTIIMPKYGVGCIEYQLQ